MRNSNHGHPRNPPPLRGTSRRETNLPWNQQLPGSFRHLHRAATPSPGPPAHRIAPPPASPARPRHPALPATENHLESITPRFVSSNPARPTPTPIWQTRRSNSRLSRRSKSETPEWHRSVRHSSRPAVPTCVPGPAQEHLDPPVSDRDTGSRLPNSPTTLSFIGSRPRRRCAGRNARKAFGVRSGRDGFASRNASGI